MEKQIIIVENIEASEIINRLDRIEKALNILCPTLTPEGTKPVEYLTRREVAELFKITLVTVHDWTNKGILKAYKIGKRVYFKRDEIEKALIQKTAKYAPFPIFPRDGINC